MQRIQIPINGLSTTSTYEDGDTYSLVNLRKKNGALHPIAPRKIEQQLKFKYDIVFVHQNNDYKNWIGVINYADESTIYYDILSEEPKAIRDYLPVRINSIEQIGNTISLITDDAIYYAIFKNGKYIFLGQLPQVPPIRFKAADKIGTIHYYYNWEYPNNSVTPENFNDATKGLVYKAMDTIINGGTDGEGIALEAQGQFLFDSYMLRYAFRLYDGTVVKHSPPIVIMPTFNPYALKMVVYDFGDTIKDESFVIVQGYRILMEYNFGNMGIWEDIIQSVDIFVSQPLGLSNIENMRTDLPTKKDNYLAAWTLVINQTAEALNNIANTSAFYYIRSIPLGEYTTAVEPDIFPATSPTSEEISKFKNLVHQEVMPIDNFSNHTYGASFSMTYNNRLHLSDIKTTFFQGYNADYFNWGSDYFMTGEYYNHVDYIIMEVEIHTGTGIERVYSSNQSQGIKPGFSTQSFLCYPDPRAKSIIAYIVRGEKWWKAFSAYLEPHPFLNIAYYINPKLQANVTRQLTSVNPFSITNKVVLSEPNKIKVSELNNPLVFPSKNVYQVGNGTIQAMATNALNVSDRNYGQYPLYVFTTEGIWTLNVGTEEVVYSSLTAPTYTEAPISQVICPTPHGVVFVTQRGLMIINGQSVEYLSPILEEPPVQLTIDLPQQTNQVIHAIPQHTFRQYVSAVSQILYNPYESEIIIRNKEYNFNYILNITDKHFYLSTEEVGFAVKNIFPQLYVIHEYDLKNFSVTENTETHCSFITRPMNFGTEDIKKLEKVIIRATLYDVTQTQQNKKALLMVHHSNDGLTFPSTRGFLLDNGNYKDYDMGLFLSTKFRYYIFSFAGIVDERSIIKYLEVQTNKEYQNTKMR